MHHIYHTEGIILGSRNYGEAGKYYSIFTRDLGMVYASAQGVRKMSSKLRYILQDLNYVKVDLVRGKDFWRVTSASKSDVFKNMYSDKEKFLILVKVSGLLKRLLAGEEANPELFTDVIKGLEERDELGVVSRILQNLGYLGKNLPKDRKLIISETNKALAQTML